MSARRIATLALVLFAGLGAWASAIAGAPAFASGEKGGEHGGEHNGSPSENASTPSCPSPNPPNQLTLVGGSPQTAMVGTAFAGGLQVALSNSDGCAVTGAAGVAVTFSAPSTGAGGVFAASGSNAVTVGADASGNVTAPALTADYTPGAYTVTASSQYGTVSFSLTNAAAGTWCATLGKPAPRSSGEPAKLTTGVGSTQSTRAGSRFPIRLAVTVTDAQGNPVAGVPVTFSAPAHGASGHFTIRSRAPHGHRLRVPRPHAVQVKTDVCGIALAPPFTANRRPGGYVVKASVKPARAAAFALVNEAK